MTHDHNPPYMQQLPDLIRLMQVMFKKMCDQRQIPLEARRDSCIHMFLAMFEEDYDSDEWNHGEDVDGLVSEAGVTEEIWDLMEDVSDNPDLYRAVCKIWDYIAWFEQPLPTHPLASVQMLPVIRWYDGRIAVLPATAVTSDTNNLAMSEGDMRSFLCSVGEQIVANMSVTADQLHDGAATLVSPHTIELFYKAMLTGIGNMQLAAALEMQSLIQLIMKVIPVPGKAPENSVLSLPAAQPPSAPPNPDLSGGWSS